MTGCAVVVGGGISGLFAALLLKQNRPARDVVVLEAEPSCGGLLRSFDYGPSGRFDHGVHSLYETGNARIDDAILGTLPEREWRFLHGREKDLGASWLDGRMQFATPYPVLLGRDDEDELVADFLRSFGDSTAEPQPNARDEALRRFGPKIASRIIIPAIEARQHMPASDVHPLALKVQGLDRVAALPLATVLKLAQIDGFDSRIAFPDQRQSPLHLISSRRAFYPAKGHIAEFTDSFIERVRRMGVRIVTDAHVNDLSIGDGAVRTLSFATKDHHETLTPTLLCWCAGLSSLGRLLGWTGTGDNPLPRPNRTVICNLLIDRKPHSEGVYYGYFHGHDRINRISFPANMSGRERPDGLHPLSLELVYPPGADTADALTATERHCRNAGVIPADAKVVFARAELLRGGYPSFGRAGIEALLSVRDRIVGTGLSNLLPFGPLVRDDLFFQFDVLRHVEETLSDA